ncbi:glutamine--fructose-6-phosphate transaminase (isomerizing) [bacterium]|nr:glutamine--fructose-6-phosphate transaminase (isomerizing) [bacterium]
MCGIVGYIGKKESLPILIDGLKRLEYRGYDSAGIAIQNGAIQNYKSVGKIDQLEKKIKGIDLFGNLGIAHTRWATHGAPSEENAHPHCDCEGKIWIVHNGIIENYQKIKEELQIEGHVFASETDSEVVAHLIEKFYKGNLLEAVRLTLGEIIGAYSLVVFHKDEPGKMVAAKKGSPLVLGLADDGIIVASDVTAIIRQTRNVIYLEDGEIAFFENENFKILNFNNEEKEKETQKIEWSLEELEKKGYSHFMLKEIFEQPNCIIDSLRGRLIPSEGKAKLGGLDDDVKNLSEIDNLAMVSCGTAHYASLIGEYMLEEYADIPSKASVASEFRYRKQLLNKNTAVLALSQSGETADTLAAIVEANDKNIFTLGIVNTVGSSIARATKAGVYNHIGPEIAVASTKAFTSQVTILTLLTLFLGRMKNMSLATGERIIKELNKLPSQIEKILKNEDEIKRIAQKYYKVSNFAFLGRKYNYPVALEGALKLKEVSYIHAEGFESGEIKHGPLALIDENFPSFFIIPQDSVYEKNLSNVQEIKARGGKVIAIATEGDEEIEKIVDDVIYIPKTLEMLTPILSVIPLQLFAYYVACLNGRDVDKPRNLAKSVTVE